MSAPIAVALLHEGMVNKRQKEVTTSITLIDLHDISRSAKTYGAVQVYVAHPAPLLQKLASMLTNHWQEGYGSTYNPDRKAAIDNLTVTHSLDDLIEKLRAKTGKEVKLIATSAKPGKERMTYKSGRALLESDSEFAYILMLGTGWGMGEALLERADYFLEPINGPTDYNHLSVRSACAIMLDRLLGL